MVRARGTRMNETRKDILANTAFAREQNLRMTACNTPRDVQKVTECAAGADHRRLGQRKCRLALFDDAHRNSIAGENVTPMTVIERAAPHMRLVAASFGNLIASFLT
jgi:hypothetical protein